MSFNWKLGLYLWLPPRIFAVLRNYALWRGLSNVVANWRYCWLTNNFGLLAKLRGPDVEVPPRHRGGGLVLVKYRTGMELTCWPDNLGVISDARNYLRHVPEIGQGDVVIDIGAHVGAVSLPIAVRGARVFAYEPDPDNFWVLMLNKQRNRASSLSAFELAVSSRKGHAAFVRGRSFAEGSLQEAGSVFAGSDSGVLTVGTTTLGAIFAEHAIDYVKLLKIDCEGGEYDILFADDTSETLRRCETLVLEVHPVRHRDNATYELYRHLRSLGFQVTVFENPGNGCAGFCCTRPHI